MVMERSRNSVRASSADFRPTVVVVDIVAVVAVVDVLAAVDVDVVVSTADETAVFLLFLPLSLSLSLSLPLSPPVVVAVDKNVETVEEGNVMQSKEICFPLPALRAATHNSATSSRLIRVTDRCR